MKAQIEYTDTFSGEANYSWARRAEITFADDATDAQIKRAAKSAVDISGARGTWTKFGDGLAFRPRGSCTILFVNFD